MPGKGSPSQPKGELPRAPKKSWSEMPPGKQNFPNGDPEEGPLARVTNNDVNGFFQSGEGAVPSRHREQQLKSASWRHTVEDHGQAGTAPKSLTRD